MARLGPCIIDGYASPPWNSARESLPRTCRCHLQTFRLVFVAVAVAVVTLSLELIMLANRMFLLEDEKVLIGNQISV